MDKLKIEINERALELTKDYINSILKTSDENLKKELIEFMREVLKNTNTSETWGDKRVIEKFWDIDKGIESIKWLIEEKLRWNDEDIKNDLTQKVFQENGLGSMLLIVFHNSTYEALNTAYPNRILPWQLKHVPAKFWKDFNNRKWAVDWLFKEKLKWSMDDIVDNVKGSTFRENGLAGLLSNSYQHSPYLLLKDIYPNENWSNIKSRFK